MSLQFSIHYYCCGRPVSPNVGPEHNIAQCWKCHQDNKIRATLEDHRARMKPMARLRRWLLRRP
jgi:hypothetical protein